ncbi:hypothetical protein F5148DRAFT_1200588 [Russula earlei]|uniref:Uncharacterized protein n=1 Tax=Russula earlei TaxID=71964 RepID=A0ACC0U9F9_9AGAM|nr:hypothetical protein F5148DRAFT_1200588 [Russula earlei]
MRTSTIVAFISLVMGVAPSFSLPSISVRSNPSGGSDDRRHGRTSQNDSQNVPPITNGDMNLYGHYVEIGNPDRGISLPLHLGAPPNMVLQGTGRYPLMAPVSRPPNQSPQNENHPTQNGNHPHGNPPNTSRNSHA